MLGQIVAKSIITTDPWCEQEVDLKKLILLFQNFSVRNGLFLVFSAVNRTLLCSSVSTKFLERNNAEVQTLDFASIPCQSITLQKSKEY